jgi:hypothetical protein
MNIIKGSMAADVSREDWINDMTTALPVTFCKSGMLFRTCYSVTQAECEETALSAARTCLAVNRDKLPATLHQPEDGRKWGAVIGRCAGATYALALNAKIVKSEACTNPK